MKRGDVVEIRMPGLPLDGRRARLEVRPGLKVAEVTFGNGQKRLIPTKCLRVVQEGP